MAAGRHIGCLKEAFHTSGTTFFYLYAKLGKDIFISGRDTPPKSNSKLRPWRRNFTSSVYLDTCLRSYGTFICVTIKNSEITHRPVTAPNAPFTNQSSPFLSRSAKCRPGNTQNGGTVLPMANLIQILNREARFPVWVSDWPYVYLA